MASLLSNLVNNLTEGIHKIKCKCRHDDKKCETCGIKYRDYDYCLEHMNFKDNIIEPKYMCCNTNYQKSLMKISKSNLLIHTNILTMIIKVCFIVAKSCLPM